MNKRHIAILGSTGSIGTQAVDIVRRHRDLFEVELLAAGSNAELLAAQARELDANIAVICNESKYPILRDLLQGSDVKAFAGAESMTSLVSMDSIDIVLTATVGFSGLRPTIEAIRSGKVIALANKETLVAAGDLVMPMAAEHNVPILPVDSEHSAIFQCLQGAGANRPRKLILTASGGPFRSRTRSEIATCTPQDALAHPSWNMGSKITIDSATMMNKGFEVIEAAHLFGIPSEKIEVVVHPQSIVHSMVEFDDGSVLAQMGNPDMRVPIAYALAYPSRIETGAKPLDLPSLADLQFEKPDYEKFPCLELAKEALRRGGNLGCILNGANEIAVAEFLKGNIDFYDISRIAEETIQKASFISCPSLDDIFESDKESRRIATEISKKC